MQKKVKNEQKLAKGNREKFSPSLMFFSERNQLIGFGRACYLPSSKDTKLQKENCFLPSKVESNGDVDSITTGMNHSIIVDKEGKLKIRTNTSVVSKIQTDFPVKKVVLGILSSVPHF